MNEPGQKQDGITRYLLPVLVVLLAIVLFSGLIFLVTRNNTMGSDFYIYYAAGRNLTINHQSPYAEHVGDLSQMAILKHPAGKGEDQLRFVYPPYGLLPILPLTSFPFPAAQAVWMAFSLVAIPVSILIGFRRVSPWLLTSLFLFYPLFFGLILGNMNMPVMAILFLLAGRLPKCKPEQTTESIVLGLLMAWATIKPQFSSFYLLVFALVAYKNKNFLFLSSFIGGLIGLLAFSFWLVPDWIPQWLGLLQRYPRYIGGQIPITPLLTHFSPTGRFIVYLIAALVSAGVVAWCLNRWWNGRITYLSVLAAAGLVAYLFHPTGLSYDQMIFILPFIFWLLETWPGNPRRSLILWLAAVISSWGLLYLSLNQIWPAATYYGLYILYILWIVFEWPRFFDPSFGIKPSPSTK